ncbi:MAG: Cof-type HAD-IIB family hydrolase [Firmicutes bacterium]|nr:Cof-type HAD-IIB family hydrolase [Bacillota bacterium]MCL5039874.1 Cof-type HAD-IIB family hydrolase [Bacillota bacterium]
MAIKLIALDMDGTLLNRNLIIPQRSLAAIAAALSQGIKVTIATGRMFCSAQPYARRLGLGDIPLVTYNGGLIKTAETGQTLFHLPVPQDLAREVVKFALARGIYIHYYLDDQVLVPEVNGKSRLYYEISQIEPIPVGDLLKALSGNPTKLLIIEDGEKMPGITRELNQEFGDRFYLTASYPFFLEIMHRDISKARSLSLVAGHLGIEREDVLAIGDSYNDLEMLEYAGLGVAIKGAPREVQAVADYVPRADGEEGVAEAIERFVLRGS